MRTRLLLLGGQAVCLGLACAFLVVPASSVFLTVYGAQRLPYTYLTVAVAGVVVSSLMARAQRRLSLAALATTVLAAFTLVVAAAWAALSLAGAEWVTFPLLVLFPLSIPVGFVLVGAQAGRLLDVRQIKAHFPRVVAGFSIGFAVGGVAAARLVAVLGGPADLLLVDVAAGLAFLGLAVATARRFPDQLAVRPVRSDAASGGLDDPPPPTLRSLLRNRLVVVVLGYQLLSAAVTQLLDFVVWERAAARYPDPSDLARFLGVFGAVINVVSVAFVFGLAGVLLSRYGVRLGLAANPVGVLVLLAVSTAVGLAGGPGTTAFFLLVCAQQVVDIALTDGTTRTSINATYQALPTAERLAAQTRVEGVGVPLALGLAGVLVLLWSATGLGIVALVGVVLVITVAWLVLAVRAYRLYGTNLRRTLTRRAWDPVALRVDDDASPGVVTRLLASPDLRDVAVGLDALADAGHPSLEGRVAWLLNDHDPGRRLAAVAAARRCGVAGVVPRLVAMARDTGEPAPLRAAAVRAAGVLGAPPEALRPLAADADPGLRASAAVAALGGPGDGDGERPASGAVLDRLRAELTGDDSVAATAALRVLADTPHAAAVPALVALAARRRPPDGLAEALAAHADALVPATADALGSPQPGARTAAPRLVRALCAATSPAADAVLLDHVADPDRDERAVVLAVLVTRTARAGRHEPVVRRALDAEVERVARALDALDVLHGQAGAADLCRALRDEVGAAASRSADLLGLLHGTRALPRTVRLLAGVSRPLALETLEVTLGRVDARVGVALLDPALDDGQRRGRLAALAPVEHLDAAGRLRDLAEDPAGHWREPWLRAAALLVMSRAGLPGSGALAAASLADPDPVVAETARAVLAR